ncbi:hypothetical protein HL653_13220 [Sphingomonas sp. AP4-R1]|uniref:hypothetical protein n=1 Tax=Sphingomonas sp. AP4-R1 TaxID=2735134 RepID=UPI00149338A1|nr:hypothetical protein [Sphingomonas sp. AP4-R1]QJU58595.1 hypothetical protein HL653_13220 [Sphingomonas sp. AP4-R1]
MRVRGMAGLIAALLLVQPSLAASLCRDSKGLFTPCPRAANSTARAILSKAPARTTTMSAPKETAPTSPRDPSPARESVATREPDSSPARSSSAATAIAQRQMLMAGTRKAHLCTDNKGLFTPCPR